MNDKIEEAYFTKKEAYFTKKELSNLKEVFEKSKKDKYDKTNQEDINLRETANGVVKKLDALAQEIHGLKCKPGKGTTMGENWKNSYWQPLWGGAYEPPSKKKDVPVFKFWCGLINGSLHTSFLLSRSYKDSEGKYNVEGTGLSFDKEKLLTLSESDIITKLNDHFEKHKDRYEELMEEYKNNIKSDNRNKSTGKNDMDDDDNPPPLNQILYGPPGTGKTYSIKDKIEEILREKGDWEEWKNSKNLIKDLEKNNRLAFTTFHPAYGYEEFMEGIRPNLKGQTISYHIHDGVFKTLCQNADSSSFADKVIEKYINSFEKGDEKELKTEGQGKTFTIKVIEGKICRKPEYSSPEKEGNNLTSGIKRYFKGKGKNSYLSSYTPVVAEDILKHASDDIIGKYINSFEKGDEKELKTKGQGKKQTIKVIEEKIVCEPQDGSGRYDITEDDIKKYFNEEEVNEPTYTPLVAEAILEHALEYLKEKPYFMIIDEINRGNIPKIFGELITLIEDTKRAGKPEEISCTLPYSGDSFSVPKNVYIIGTMNTADKSLVSLDIALRRRFVFEEMMPDYKTLKDKKNLWWVADGLKEINERIEKDLGLGRSHTIGHAFFIDCKDDNDIREAFEYKVLPLLQEYTYDVWEKISVFLFGKEKAIEKILEDGENEEDLKKHGRFYVIANHIISHKGASPQDNDTETATETENT